MGKDWQGTGLVDVTYAVRICLGRLKKTMKRLGMCPVSWSGTSKIQFLEYCIGRFAGCCAHKIWVWRNTLLSLESLEVSLKYSFRFFKFWNLSRCLTYSCKTVITVVSVVHVRDEDAVFSYLLVSVVVRWSRNSDTFYYCITIHLFAVKSIYNCACKHVLCTLRHFMYSFSNKRKKHVLRSKWEPITGAWRKLHDKGH